MDIGNVSTFWLLRIMLLQTLVCRFFCGHTFNSLRYIPRDRTAGWYNNSIFNFLSNGQTVFQRRCAVLHLYQQCRRVPICPHLLLSVFFIMAILMGVKWYLIAVICISLITNIFPSNDQIMILVSLLAWLLHISLLKSHLQWLISPSASCQPLCCNYQVKSSHPRSPSADHAGVHLLLINPPRQTLLWLLLKGHAKNSFSCSPPACNLAKFRRMGTEWCWIPLGDRKLCFFQLWGQNQPAQSLKTL